MFRKSQSSSRIDFLLMLFLSPTLLWQKLFSFSSALLLRCCCCRRRHFVAFLILVIVFFVLLFSSSCFFSSLPYPSHLSFSRQLLHLSSPSYPPFLPASHSSNTFQPISTFLRFPHSPTVDTIPVHLTPPFQPSPFFSTPHISSPCNYSQQLGLPSHYHNHYS